MKEIKYILSLLMLTISSMVYSQSTSPYYVRVLHVLNNESVVDTYILPSQLDSITFANYYNVSAISSDESKGVVTVDNSLVFQGNNVTLTANATEGHELYNWTLNGEVVSTENPYYPVVTQNAEYVANFGPIRPEIVDLGLPSGLKWASFNLGALSPEQAGDYYMWGETFPRTEFVSDATNSLYTYTDNPDVLPLSADAANVTLQGNWRMPTIEEWEELLDRNYCAWSNVTLNGVVVRCVTSKVNGNKLYFPKPGCGIGIGIQPDKDGWYWSSSINKTESDGITILPYNSAYSFFMYGSTSEWSSVDDVVSILERDRWGFVIRPVYDENLNNSVSE